jgi:acetoin:2,6-dichlorophenolindophenol oxidoreductase subunit alpha
MKTTVAANDKAVADKGDAQKWLGAYRRMTAIRAFEEQVNDLYTRAIMPGLAHLYIGEEAVAVGICDALTKDDYITSTHRGHGHCLAKGASPDRMFAELLGKEAGYCKGKGGSMHIADPSTGNLGANAIVAGSVGIATGAAFSAKRLGTGSVAVCFFGEGALGQGVLYEVMNLAAIWKLPAIYVCENNMYNEYTHFSEVTAGDTLTRAEGFGVKGVSVDGQDVRAVNAATEKLVARARRGEGPSFLLCNTYRYRGHHVGDMNREYRTKQEESKWLTERDPIKLLTDWMVAEKLTDAAQLASVEKQVRAEIEQAAKFALDTPYPKSEEVDQDVYA